MRKTDNIIGDIVKKENTGCIYDIRIFGIPIYNLIRSDIRKQFIKKNDENCMEASYAISIKKLLVSTIRSLVEIFISLIKKKNIEVAVFPFQRLDAVDGIYMDKFTDPLTRYISRNVKYTIFQFSRGGTHYSPRINQKEMINVDAITVLSVCLSYITGFYFKNKYKSEFDSLWNKIEDTLLSEAVDRKKYSSKIIQSLISYKIVQFLFKKFKTQYVLCVARPLDIVAASRSLNIKTFELQHGITYGESDLYSGYNDETVIPDKFLAFGDNNPKDVYGIDTHRIINIGWAFGEFLNNLITKKESDDNSVLVVSDPEITDCLIQNIKSLAIKFRECNFYYRCHPLEILSNTQKRMIEEEPNIFIQDNKKNIAETLKNYKFVVGENSTVLYEALSYGNIVGKLFYEGLRPIYLVEDDKQFFYEIKNDDDFFKFINNAEEKPTRSIYSKFKEDVFKELLNS